MTKVEELKEEFERVRIAVRQIYCVKGSEFCRPELEMVFNLLAKTPELIEAVREEERENNRVSLYYTRNTVNAYLSDQITISKLTELMNDVDIDLVKQLTEERLTQPTKEM